MKCTLCKSHNILLKRSRRGYYYECLDCHAKVGCHQGTKKPMGTFADKEMRNLRNKCHKMFDYTREGQRRWITSKERMALYRKLAESLNIPQSKCHFAKLSREQLKQAEKILETWY